MKIVKAGKANANGCYGEFRFYCLSCECEWWANRDEKEVIITPPFMPFDVYCKCPSCGHSSSFRNTQKYMKNKE